MPSDEGGMRDFLARVFASLAIALCLLAPACGGDSEPDRFSSGYNAAIERLDRASQEVIALAPARQRRALRELRDATVGVGNAQEALGRAVEGSSG